MTRFPKKDFIFSEFLILVKEQFKQKYLFLVHLFRK